MAEKPEQGSRDTSVQLRRARVIDVELRLSKVKALPKLPGVYRMLDQDGQLLYIGKAKNLKARVSSYFLKTDQSSKTRHLVARIADIDTTVTGSETEALLLEQTLIKRHRPVYNILLRDDKSYPYIYISQHAYPRITSVRGKRSRQGQTFGPFPSGSAVRMSLSVLQKAFRVRQCEDSFFRNRSRPCLEYQIQRCTGPCVGLVSTQAYTQAVQDTVQFLKGEATQLMHDLTARMEQAAVEQDYEQAALVRDQIKILRQVQEVQHADTGQGEVDVFAVVQDEEFVCVQTVHVRKGRIVGGDSWFQKAQLELTDGEVLESYIAQYYLQGQNMTPPDEIIAGAELPSRAALTDLLQESLGRITPVLIRPQGHKAAWLLMAKQNASQALVSHRAHQVQRSASYQQLRQWLMPDLVDGCAEQMECFDISHTQGEATKGSCVVFGEDGPNKSLYRQYNIQTAKAGDDYQAMKEVITRRYQRLVDDALWPWLIVIDGGKNQLMQAARVLKTLESERQVSIPELCLLGLAKGVTRKAGFERIYRIESLRRFIRVVGEFNELACLEEIRPPEGTSLRLLHRLRDESHRFAVHGHRQARDKARVKSGLESIPGVGAKRRSALLKYFGGLQGVKRASVGDLARVQGVSAVLAVQIYHSLRGEVQPEQSSTQEATNELVEK